MVVVKVSTYAPNLPAAIKIQGKVFPVKKQLHGIINRGVYMAFPGTYNINYYKGDTLEFRVYPKDSTGAAFPLSQYVSPNGVTKFTMAPSRGATTGIIEGFAEISNDQTNILCAITPANGTQLVPGTEYVYDVEIARSSANYDYVYTLLTGTVSVTEQVTLPGTLEIPNNPTDLVLGGLTTNSITVGWTAPTTGGEVETYKLYILEYTVDPIVLAAALAADPHDEVEASVTNYTFTGLDPNTGYLIGILSSNDVGDALAFEGLTPLILSNLGVPITTLPEVS